MTVGLTNCQLQGVYNIRTYDVCWGLHGGFTGVGVEGVGAQYVMKTHSQLHPQARKDSIPYVKQDIKASPFKWCIKTYFLLLSF